MTTLTDGRAMVDLATRSARDVASADVAAVVSAPRVALSGDAHETLVQRIHARCVAGNEVVADAQDDVAGWGALVPALGNDTALVVTRRGNPFTAAERERLSALRRHLDNGLTAAALHTDLQRQAHTDALTGLCNHRRFHELLARSLATADDLTLLLIDLDDSKAINDTHGHQSGDEVLARVGEVLAHHAPPGGFAARYGGEELAIVTPSGAPEAGRLAEEVRARIHDLRVRTPDGESCIAVSASIGAATAMRGSAAEDLVRRADDALYAAKREGKNRVVHCRRDPAARTEARVTPS